MCGPQLKRSYAEGSASLISQRSRKFLGLYDDLYGGKCIYCILISSISLLETGFADVPPSLAPHTHSNCSCKIIFFFDFCVRLNTDLSASTNDMARLSVDEELHSIPADHDRVVHVDDTDFRLQAPLVRCVGRSHFGNDRRVGCGKI